MKDELKKNFVPPSYYARLLDMRHQFSQSNESTNECVAKFDEFFIRCNVLVTEYKAQILSRFRAGLREDLRTKLLARGVTEIERAYALVQDLDVVRSNHAFRVMIKEH